MDFFTRFQRMAGERSGFCLGVDPSAAVLAHWGCSDDASGLADFCQKLAQGIDKTTALSTSSPNTTPNTPSPTSSTLALVKPQSAYFERHGSGGIEALQEFVRLMQQRDILVLLDVKRGDIGETNTAYAEAYFNTMKVDAITVQPFMGFAALTPFFEVARAAGGYLFVVTASSNAEGIPLQQAQVSNNQSVSEYISAAIAAENKTSPICGAVIGATRQDITDEMRNHLRDALILAPGIGAQGAGYDAFQTFPNPLNVIPTSARGVLLAEDFSTALEAQCHQAKILRT